MTRLTFGKNSLANMSPEIATEWHPTKNGFLHPNQIGYRSAIKVWWLGKCGHDWEATVGSRTRGSKCPVCSGRVPEKGVNDFATMMPKLVEQWHSTRNNDLLPSDVTVHSGRCVWWVDSYGHEWIATPASRANGTGCPICSSRLKTSFPEVAVYFYVRNAFADAVQHYNPGTEDFGNINLDIWIPTISTGVEYDGAAWHTDAKRDRHKDNVCAANGMTLVRIREIGCVEYESPSVNVIIRDDIYSKESLTSAIRQLMLSLGKGDADVDVSRDEDEISALMGVVEYGCSIGYLHPDVASSWHPTKNGRLTPYMYTPGSSRKVWWLCGKCGHEWNTSISVRCIDGCGCPECARSRRKDYKTPKLGQSLAEKRPDIAKTWHSTKNGELTPSDVTSKSKRVVWWACPSCGKEWQQSIAYRTDAESYVCGECTKAAPRTPKGGESLADLYPRIASEWDYDRNVGATPQTIGVHSAYNAWWTCSECGCTWQKAVVKRTRFGNACCPDCNRRRIRKPAIGNDLLSKRPEIARDWAQDLNNGLSAQDVPYMSNKKFWWRCHACGTEWQAQVDRRSSGTTSCPTCSKEKTVKRLRQATPGNSLPERRPDLMRMWSIDLNKDTDPSGVAYKSNRDFWWICDLGHTWQASPNKMTTKTKCLCPICSGRKLLIGYNDLATMSPEIAKEWHPQRNGNVTPSDTKYNSSEKRWWQCSICGREWESPVRVRTIDGKGCRSCSQRRRHERD